MIHQVHDSAGRRGLRQRIFSYAYRRVANDELLSGVAEYRRRLLAPLQGTVVEFGPGTGANLAWFNAEAVRWIGIEPNLFMHGPLLQAAAQYGIQGELHTTTAEATGLPAACADAVISTHVMCSVTDAPAACREALRLLRPGGVFAFIEHVGAPHGSGLRRLQRGIRPVWGLVADGCHPDRDLEATIHTVGFSRVEITPFRIRVPVVSPHIAGQAWKG
ncbi:MAG: class I SAM-dependent methyltransferase [Anaerolineae bacterium]|nr:class I SAM-dependent methyltransferase [Anaerolineae bacterium]